MKGEMFIKAEYPVMLPGFADRMTKETFYSYSKQHEDEGGGSSTTETLCGLEDLLPYIWEAFR